MDRSRTVSPAGSRGGRSDPLDAELASLAARIRRHGAAARARTAPGPARLHDLHRDLRRSRQLLAWTARSRSSRGRTTDRERTELVRRLRRLGRIAGAARDADVSLALWGRFGPPSSGRRRPRGPAGRFAIHLAERARRDREAAAVALRTERNRDLFETVARRLEDMATGRPGRSPLAAALDRAGPRLVRRLARARRRAVHRGDPKDFHRVRSAIRRLRLAATIAAALGRGPSVDRTRRFASLQRQLGELHDRDLLAAALDRRLPRWERTGWGARFRADRERRRTRLLAALHALPPKRELRRILLDPAPSGSSRRVTARPALRRARRPAGSAEGR
ncbi:MAG: CHAD domain-containing protein [Thermoplasmata archaeon]